MSTSVLKTTTIRLMKTMDVEAVVIVHRTAFSGFFLTFLGPAFLRQLYEAILLDPSGIAYVFEQQGKVVGFVAGTDQPVGFYRRLLHQRWWRFGLAAVRPTLQSPSIVPRLLRAFQMPQQTKLPPRTGMLMSIAVSPKVQSNGGGQALVYAFLNEARQRKLTQVYLTTDRVNNDQANRFYRKLGFTCIRSYETPEGRTMNEYAINL